MTGMDKSVEDPFNEALLLSTICALKDVPLVPGAVKKRKRRPRPPPKRHVYLHRDFLVDPPSHYKPVPPEDPRLKIPYKILETFAGGDFELHAKFMRQLCHPQLQYYMQYDGKQNPYGPNRRHFVGLEEHISLSNATMISCPDLVPQIYDGPHVYYDELTNESFASYKVIVSMTKTGLIQDAATARDIDSKYVVEKMPPHIPIVTSHMIAKFTYSLNADNIMTKYCLLFRVMFNSSGAEPNFVNKKDSKKLKAV